MKEEGDIGLFDFRLDGMWLVESPIQHSSQVLVRLSHGHARLVILDETSRITVEGWDNAWPSIYNTLQQGDEVAILNVSLDAWAVDVKANLEKGSTIHVISRAED